MNKIIALGIAVLFTAAMLPTAEANEASRTERFSYVPGPYVTVIYCSEEHHAWIPLEPTEPWLDNPEGWANSGEPECAPHDALNIANEAQGAPRTDGGYGGGAFELDPSEFGGTLHVTTDDLVFGTGLSPVWISITAEDAADDVSEPGCGPNEVQIPEAVAGHWQSDTEEPRYYAWVYVDVIAVDDDTNLCFSSTGTVEGTITQLVL